MIPLRHQVLLYPLAIALIAVGLAFTCTLIFAIIGIPLLGGGLLLLGWLRDPDTVEDEKRHWTGVPETEGKE